MSLCSDKTTFLQKDVIMNLGAGQEGDTQSMPVILSEFRSI